VGDSPLFCFMMGERERIDKIRALVITEISMMGFDLIDLSLAPGMLRITIDKPGGVRLNDCVVVNRRISVLLDADDPIPGTYKLEVSSPGLNRELMTEKDFEHFTGRMIKVKTADGVYKGILKGLVKNGVILDMNGEDIMLKQQDIIKANLHFDF